MPFPVKNYRARYPIMYIVFMQLSTLAATIRFDQFYEIYAIICQNLAKKILKIFYLINEQMSTKFEAKNATKKIWGLMLLLFDKILLKF